MRLQRHWSGKFSLTIGLIGSLGCAVMATSHDELFDPAAEWSQAQRDISALAPSVTGDPFAVGMDQFAVEPEEEPFYCGDTGLHALFLVYGCFRATPQDNSRGVIRYVPTDGALRHEARHAILFALGDPRWPDVGH